MNNEQKANDEESSYEIIRQMIEQFSSTLHGNETKQQVSSMIEGLVGELVLQMPSLGAKALEEEVLARIPEWAYNLYCGFKVDYVVTYLDPFDPYWQEQFMPYSQNEMRMNPERYDDDGVKNLKYHFRGIAKYTPWINNVYLVVFSESQVPDWVNRNTVHVITDDMFIPHKFLPTFNSSVKTTHVHRIPGLEEHFILADDDMFTINEIGKYEYFNQDGTPRPFYTLSNGVLGSDPRKGVWPRIVFNSSFAASKISGKTYPDGQTLVFPYRHLPIPLLKSDVIHDYEIIKDDLEHGLTKTRGSTNINALAWIFANNYRYSNKLKIKMVERQWHNSDKNHSVFQEHEQGTQIFNINRNGRGDFYQKEFEQFFPEKCKYEK